MARIAEITKRRQTVGELWIRGVPAAKIANQMQVTERTIRSDIKLIRGQLAAERLQDLAAQRDRAVAVLRKIQMEAWSLFARIDDRSTNKVGCLNSVLAAEQQICKIEGTIGADVRIDNTTNVNVMSDTEWLAIQETIDKALQPFSEARYAVSAALMQLSEGGHAKLN